MKHRVDDILETLSDVGQSSLEQGHPEDRGVVPDGVCWRCVRRAVAADSDLCLPCRSFLLGDTDDDPAAPTSAVQQVVSDEDIFLGQSSYVSQLFDEPAHEIIPARFEEILVELRGGLSGGRSMRVAPARDGGPPLQLFAPVGMDHGVMRTERYVLDDLSGPGLWCYDAIDDEDESIAPEPDGCPT